MIKVGLAIEEKYLHRFHYLLLQQDALRDLGIELRVVEAAATQGLDALIVQQTIARTVPAADTLPLLVYERIGGAPVNVSAKDRTLLQRQDVKLWLKETDFRDPELHNAEMIHGRYHLTLLGEGSQPYPASRPSILLSEADLAKLRCCFPIHLQQRYDHLRAATPKPIAERRIDLMFAGTMTYDHPAVGYHRRALAAKMVEASEKYSAFLGLGQILPRLEFENVLLDNKVFVSPYGSGEYSWKDFEAIYAGCILIKARSSFVKHYGFDVYKSGAYCIECEPDFSDLTDIVDNIFAASKKWEEFAGSARTAMFDAVDPKQYATEWDRMIRQALS